MIRARCLIVLASILVLVTAAPAARAQSWDLIYADQFEITLCESCGLTLAGTDFALLVNTGAAIIDEPTLFAGSFSCVPGPDTTCFIQSSHPGFRLIPFINNPAPGVIAPILPGEAVGGVTPFNQVLLGPIAPGETLRNTSPNQFLAFQVGRLQGTTFEGDVVFDVEMMLAGARAVFQLHADMRLGTGGDIAFLHASRVSSAPIPTASRTSSWGKIKTLYR